MCVCVCMCVYGISLYKKTIILRFYQVVNLVFFFIITTARVSSALGSILYVIVL